MKRVVALTLGMGLLLGCQAEELKVEISADQMISAASGDTVYLEFEAEIGEGMSEIDDEKRATIAAIEGVFSKYFPDADIETEIGSDSYKIEIEGELALSSSTPETGAPWFVEMQRQGENEHLVRLMPSGTFSAFRSEMSDINFMIAPDEFQGVIFKVNGGTGRLVFGGAYLDGEPKTYSVLELEDKKHSLSFKEGIWTETAAGFIFSTQ
jgi:hypothetical protein